MTALICGSFAYDNIMVFPDFFKNHILPDKLHILNVSFMVPEMRREFGGCSGNIIYNLNMLDADAVPMGTVGKDFEPYADWLDHHNINRRHVTVIDTEFTAQAFITTDMDDNQITAFHAGAMTLAHHNKVSDAQNISLGIISPDGRDGMIQHAEQFEAADIPFIFDPGQGMPMFDGNDLKKFIDQASWITVNDYEWQLMQERTKWSQDEIISRVNALVVTRGGNGSSIHTSKQSFEVPVAKVSEINDPTGCGDAYRAGMIYGMMNDMDWETTGRIASLMGAYAVEKNGTQNHAFTMDEFRQRFRENFNYNF